MFSAPTDKTRPASPVFCRRRDWLALCLVLAAALAAFALAGGFAGAPGAAAEVRVAGQTVARLPLAQNAALPVEHNGHHLTVRVADGQVWVNADCPDRLCEAMSPAARPGQSIVCLPAGVSVTVTGAAAPDGVAY